MSEVEGFLPDSASREADAPSQARLDLERLDSMRRERTRARLARNGIEATFDETTRTWDAQFPLALTEKMEMTAREHGESNRLLIQEFLANQKPQQISD